MSAEDEEEAELPVFENDEDPGACSVCGKEYEIVRPGKSQPTCDCHMRCACGRMKNWYCDGEHPTDKKGGGFLCPACGTIGPGTSITSKSLVSRPTESEDFQKASLLTYIKLGKVDLPIPFGHGFFFNTEDSGLVYSPHAFHAEDRHSWSMDSDFPICVPEEVDLHSKAGFWAMMASIIIVALDGHPEASKWHVVYEVASKLEGEERAKAVQMRRYENCKLVIVGLVGVVGGGKAYDGTKALKMELAKLLPDLNVKGLSTALTSLPFEIGRYPLGRCLQIQRDLFACGAYVLIKS